MTFIIPRPKAACPERSRREGPFPSAELDPGRLDLGELVEGVQGLVAADTGLLVAAERRGDVAAVVGVDPHRAGTQALGELEGLVDVGREDRRGEPVDRVVWHGERLIGILAR